MAHSIVTQLLSQLPMFLAYLIAMIVAVTFWQRCPRQSLFTIIAAALFLVVSVAQTVLTSYLIHTRNDLPAGGEQLGTILTVIGLIGGVLRALGFGLLLAAVFTGRSRVQSPWTD